MFRTVNNQCNKVMYVNQHKIDYRSKIAKLLKNRGKKEEEEEMCQLK